MIKRLSLGVLVAAVLALGVIGATSAATVARNTALLQILCQQRDKSGDRLSLCRELAQAAVERLVALDAAAPARPWE